MFEKVKTYVNNKKEAREEKAAQRAAMTPEEKKAERKAGFKKVVKSCALVGAGFGAKALLDALLNKGNADDDIEEIETEMDSTEEVSE